MLLNPLARGLAILTLLAAILTPAPVAGAADLLIPYDAVWKYDVSGTDLGTAWREPGFNDTGWPSGQGVLAYPTTEILPLLGASIRTSLVLSNAARVRFITYYFRTHFSVTSTNVVLIASNLVDDGAVFYLNGVEIGPRPGMAPAPTVVNWQTLATRALDVLDYGVDKFIVVPINLVEGENLLTVEVHQQTNTSSDVVFGMSLTAVPAQPPVITNHPASRTVETGTLLSFTVGAESLVPMSYQWSKDNVPILRATNATYAFTAQPANAGVYAVSVSNQFGGAVSQDARLEVYVIPPAITVQPVEAELLVGQTLSNYVGATGSQLVCQWFRDGLPLRNATNASLVLTNVSETNSGAYSVVVTNYAGSVTSRLAAVLVEPDTWGPAIVSAIAQSPFPPYLIVVTLSKKPYGPSGTNTANFVITELGTSNTLVVSNSTLNGFQVRLRTSPFQADRKYVLTVNNVRDSVTGRTNVIAPDSRVPVLFNITRPLVSMDQVWRWTEDNVPLPPEWKTNHLAPYPYGEAPAVFYHSFGAVDYCRGAKNTAISSGPQTHYFSTLFTLPPLLFKESSLQLVSLVDDGAVYYLNGVPISYYNMATGPVSHTNLSLTGITDAKCVTNSVPVTNLVEGVNVLAVEVHQSGSTAGDVVFGTEVTGRLVAADPLPPESIPALRCQREGDQVTLSWTGSGWALEFADRVQDRWHEVQPDMANPYTTTLTNGVSRFWRLHRKQW